MIISQKTIHVFSLRLIFIVFSAIALPAFAQSQINSYLTLEANVTDADGNPYDLSGKNLNFYVSNASGNCYLYGETAQAGDSQGNILHKIGSGASYTALIFSGNTSGTTSIGSPCSVTSSDTRIVQVYEGITNLGSIQLGSVPYAHNAETLSGKSVNDFAANNYTGITTALGYIPAASSTVDALSATVASLGSPSGYLTKGNNLSDLTSSSTARTNLGLGSLATANSIDLGSASATGIIADARLANQSNVVSGTQYTKVTVDSKGRITSGSQLNKSDISAALTYIPAASATVDALSATVAGLNSVSGNYLVNANNLSDLTSSSTARTNLGLGSIALLNTVDLGSAEASGTLAIARTPAYIGDVTKDAASNTLVLSNSGVLAGTYSKVTVDSKGRVTSSSALTLTDISTALGYTPASAMQWTTSGTSINYMTGDIGIGTTTPVTTLDVSGAIRVGYTSASCTASIAGALRFVASNTATSSGTIEICTALNGMAVAAITAAAVVAVYKSL